MPKINLSLLALYVVMLVGMIIDTHAQQRSIVQKPVVVGNFQKTGGGGTIVGEARWVGDDASQMANPAVLRIDLVRDGAVATSLYVSAPSGGSNERGYRQYDKSVNFNLSVGGIPGGNYEILAHNYDTFNASYEGTRIEAQILWAAAVGFPRAVSFQFGNLDHVYDGSPKSAQVIANPGHAEFDADVTKGPIPGTYSITASGKNGWVGSGSANLTIAKASQGVTSESVKIDHNKEFQPRIHGGTGAGETQMTIGNPNNWEPVGSKRYAPGTYSFWVRKLGDSIYADQASPAGPYTLTVLPPDTPQIYTPVVGISASARRVVSGTTINFTVSANIDPYASLTKIGIEEPALGVNRGERSINSNTATAEFQWTAPVVAAEKSIVIQGYAHSKPQGDDRVVKTGYASVAIVVEPKADNVYTPSVVIRAQKNPVKAGEQIILDVEAEINPSTSLSKIGIEDPIAIRNLGEVGTAKSKDRATFRLMAPRSEQITTVRVQGYAHSAPQGAGNAVRTGYSQVEITIMPESAPPQKSSSVTLVASPNPATVGGTIVLTTSAAAGQGVLVKHNIEQTTAAGQPLQNLGEIAPNRESSSYSQTVGPMGSAGNYYFRANALDSGGTVARSPIVEVRVQEGMLRYNLAMTSIPEGAGRLTGAGSYVSGTQVSVQATPTGNYQFIGWQGDLTGGTNPSTIIMDRNKNVQAVFAKKRTDNTATITATFTADRCTLEPLYQVKAVCKLEVSETASYLWKLIGAGGTEIAPKVGQATPTATFEGLLPGSYVARCEVVFNDGTKQTVDSSAMNLEASNLKLPKVELSFDRPSARPGDTPRLKYKITNP